MSKEEVFFADGDDPKMRAAFKRAQDTFKYFWRELSWERRRIVPALDVACVKAAFSQKRLLRKELVEHMWINEIGFDAEQVTGVLINDPTELSNIKKGDAVAIPLSQISDWLFAVQGQTYGGFTIQAMRSEMDEAQRRAHDEAWGLNFGDYNDVLIVYEQKEHPENLIEHPMSRNMKQRLIESLQQHPDILISFDDAGYTQLHRETIAGNLTVVEVLLAAGVDKQQKTKRGKTALDFARQLDWSHIIPVLQA